ncbi:MAG: DMT family transporter [Acidobacteria bacterium]|nr:DMT family transporter [Acidobacteriota bacterium]
MRLALLIPLLSALAWALFDALRKRLARDVKPLHLGLWLPLGQAPLLAAWALWKEPFGLPAASLPFLFGSALCNVFALVLFLDALRRSPLSLTIPLLSLTPLGTTLLAWVFRHQAPTPAQWLGAGLVLAGAATLGLRGGAWAGLGAFVKEPGVRRMAGTALLWSATAVLDSGAVGAGAGAWYAPLLNLAVALPLAAWMLRGAAGEGFGDAGRALLRLPLLSTVALLLGAAALAVQIEAFRFASVGFIEVLKRGLGMASAVLLGRLIFKEPVTAAKVVAVLLLTLGVALVVGWQ